MACPIHWIIGFTVATPPAVMPLISSAQGPPHFAQVAIALLVIQVRKYSNICGKYRTYPVNAAIAALPPIGVSE
jgi:hypothetical protein